MATHLASEHHGVWTDDVDGHVLSGDEVTAYLAYRLEKRAEEAAEEWLLMTAAERRDALADGWGRGRYGDLPAAVLLSNPAGH